MLGLFIENIFKFFMKIFFSFNNNVYICINKQTRSINKLNK